VYAYFNNDPDAVSTHDARRLRERAYGAAGLAVGSPRVTSSRSDAPGSGALERLRHAGEGGRGNTEEAPDSRHPS